MKYWYKLSDSKKWEEETIAGKDFMVHLYEETPEIVADFEKEPFSDWWPLCRHDSYLISDEDAKYEFESLKDAETDLYCDLNEDLYCKLVL